MGKKIVQTENIPDVQYVNDAQIPMELTCFNGCGRVAAIRIMVEDGDARENVCLCRTCAYVLASSIESRYPIPAMAVRLAD